MTASAAARTLIRLGLPFALTILLAGLLAGCVEAPPPPPPTEFRPLTYEYLGKLRVTVASIDISNAWTPNLDAGGQHVESLAPVEPADALRRMAQDRLIPAGSAGHATFVINDASLVQTAGSYQGSMQVHLDIYAADGSKSGFAEANVRRTRTIVDYSTAGARAALYELTKQMMSDMNVEFEFQVRRSLHDYLQAATETAPTPAPVESQDLNGAQPAPGAPAAQPDQLAPPAQPGPPAPGPPPAPDSQAAPAVPPPATPEQPPPAPGQPVPLAPPGQPAPPVGPAAPAAPSPTAPPPPQ